MAAAWAIELLGLQVNRTGFAPTADVLDGKTVVGLYFSASWCVPCKVFTPQLAYWYHDLVGAGKPIAIVFLSSDKDSSAFEAYFSSQPWVAVPFAERRIKGNASSHFAINGIPALILLNGATGEPISRDPAFGRRVVREDPTGFGFPWGVG